MRKFGLLMGAAIAFATLSQAAYAVEITYTSGTASLAAPYGGTETVLENFSEYADGTKLAPGNEVLSTSIANVGTKPTVLGAGDKYLSVGATGFGVYTYNLAKAAPLVSFVLGTLDSYNEVVLNIKNTTTNIVTTTDLTGNAIIGGATFNQDGRVSFGTGASTSLIQSITFISTKPAFEIASIASAAPEPAAWAMMILGFGIVGATLRTRRRQGNLVAA